MQGGRGSAALAAPSSLQEKDPGPVMGNLWPDPATLAVPTLLAGTEQGGGHTGCGCHRAGRKCAEQVRSPSSSPAPGSRRRPPTHPALPNHQFRQNSRSFLNSRCRLHGRPYGLTQGFTNSTVSMQSGKWWGGWPSLAGCSAAHACVHVCTCECTCLYKDPPPRLLSPCLTLSRIRSAVLNLPSHEAGPSGLPEVTPTESKGPLLPRSPTPPPLFVG
ncbi:unnamed protein product [Nyctereutes procyonoides]|uniref:(raccoon dog) hypothetical protein n=1 Tax=Nyctereutes procyonoides TaxID=34880 RepID=A0A811ZA02_NYCPR|nr:unnamed protein product [Nyctereutes procyonoides]